MTPQQVPELRHDWRCSSCGTPNEWTVEACGKCGWPRPANAVETANAIRTFYRTFWFFQCIFLGLAFVLGSRANGIVFLTLMLLAWWGGLALFRSKDYFGFLDNERRRLELWALDQQSPTKRRIARAVTRFVIWPLYLSSDFYLVCLVVGVGLYYGARWLGGAL